MQLEPYIIQYSKYNFRINNGLDVFFFNLSIDVLTFPQSKFVFFSDYQDVGH
jgi:hypothetical protein